MIDVDAGLNDNSDEDSEEAKNTPLRHDIRMLGRMLGDSCASMKEKQLSTSSKQSDKLPFVSVATGILWQAKSSMPFSIA